MTFLSGNDESSSISHCKSAPEVPVLRLLIHTFLIGIHTHLHAVVQTYTPGLGLVMHIYHIQTHTLSEGFRVLRCKYCLRLLYWAQGLLIDSVHNALTCLLQFMNNASLPLTHIMSLTYLTHFLCLLVLIPQLISPSWMLLDSLLYPKHI